MVAFAFVLSLSAMVAAQLWYVSYRTGPAIESVKALPGVQDAWLEKAGPANALWVQVAPVEDVPGVVGQLRRAAESGRLGRVSEVVLVDRRDGGLLRALRRLQIPLQEGAASGSFTEMEQRVHAQSAELGIPVCRVYVDDQAVYLLLQRGDSYLYEVVHRPAGVHVPSTVTVRTEGPQAVSGKGVGST
mgnify:CR=1 FL=1